MGLALWAAGPAAAQWSDDPSTNLLVADGGSSPAVTHIAPDGAGGCWVTWYDASSGYDVLLQHLDAAGHSQFMQPIVVDDQAHSWVQDFELTVDTSGRPVLAWPGATKIEAACINIDGTVAWHNEYGASGAYLGQAQVAPLSDGAIALAWMQDDISVIQRITPEGDPDGAPVAISVSGTLVPSDLKPSGDGSFIASFVHYTSFSGPKRLKAQKFNANMSSQWGLNPIDVFTSGSLQYGNYPEFVADSSGGAVLCWYSTSPLMARMQWITSGGQRLFGTSGMAVTAETSMVHVSPAACIDPKTGDASVFWVRQSSSQGSSGIQANRINAKGVRLLGATGVQIMAPSSLTSCLDLHAVQLGSLATGSWINSPNVGDERVEAAALTDTGNVAWLNSPAVLSNSNSNKTDMVTCVGNAMLISCWADDRIGANRLYAQNINQDGSLGGSAPCPSDLNTDGTVNVSDLLAVIAAWGPCVNCPEDIDGSGGVDVTDLLSVIAAWGDCP